MVTLRDRSLNIDMLQHSQTSKIISQQFESFRWRERQHGKVLWKSLAWVQGTTISEALGDHNVWVCNRSWGVAVWKWSEHLINYKSLHNRHQHHQTWLRSVAASTTSCYICQSVSVVYDPSYCFPLAAVYWNMINLSRILKHLECYMVKSVSSWKLAEQVTCPNKWRQLDWIMFITGACVCHYVSSWK